MIREARIYLSDKSDSAIVTAIYDNEASLLYEQEETLIVSNRCDPIAIASTLRNAIERFKRRDRNLRDYKITEWPAYRASNCRSVKEFESRYLQIFVKAANESELCYLAFAKPIGEEEIELRVTLNRYGSDEEIGQKILRLFDICSKWNSLANGK
jgi:hypothetical protein